MTLDPQFIDPLRTKVDDLVALYLRQQYNRGLVVGILRKGQQHIFGYGKLATEDAKSPDGDTLFEIGSITKVFTANLLADMIGREEVRLDDPVQKYLPAEVHMPTLRGKEITLYHLSTHTSSLPRLPGNLGATIKDEQNPYANYTRENLYQYLSRCRLWR